MSVFTCDLMSLDIIVELVLIIKRFELVNDEIFVDRTRGLINNIFFYHNNEKELPGTFPSTGSSEISRLSEAHPVDGGQRLVPVFKFVLK